MFPTIKHLNDLLPFVEQNQQIRVKPCETTGHTVVCYMVQDEDTFAGAHEAYERECRGISFDKDGNISARTMHKFFNVGERAETQPDTIDWAKVVRIMEKRDGSMVTPVMIDREKGKYKFKTKKSFTTPEAALADQVAKANTSGDLWIKNLLLGGYTPTFEITSPRFPIVVRYEKDELTLLHIRHNETGQYLTEKEIKFLGCPFPVVENLIGNFVGVDFVAWDYLRRAAETTQGIEGWVVQLENGDMFKVKTQWYVELHHSVTFTRWRDIARTVCADKSDDLKAAFAMVGRDIEPILEVERKIKSRITDMSKAAGSIVAAGRAANFDAKTMAISYNGHPLFGQIMRLFRGQEVNWTELYERTHLDNDWSLEVVA